MGKRLPSDRQIMVQEFAAFRRSMGRPFDPALVPRSFSDPKELELAYWSNEGLAADRPKVLPPPAPSSSELVTRAHLHRRIDASLQLIGKWMATVLAPLQQKHAALEKRVAELETAGNWL
jgi:hypothetical protein